MSGPGARVLERIERICRDPADATELRRRVLDELRAAVGFDAYAWPLTDPESSVASAPVADVPCLAELPLLIRLKYLTDVNRWTTLVDPPVGVLSEATGGEPSRSLVWRDLLCRYDVVDVASVVFRDAHGCWGFLDLWRTGSSARFTQSEAAVLGAVSGPVATALRRCQAATFVVRAPREAPRGGPAVLLLSTGLSVVAQTPQSDAYLRLIVPAPEDRAPIPAGAYNVAAQLLAREAGVDQNPPTTRLHLSDGLWVTLRAARIADAGAGSEETAPVIAVTIEEASPAERMAVFARAFALTEREAELLAHLAAGSDTRQVAARMFLSEYTLQDHLKAMFAKTSTHSRPALLARALGT